MARANLSRAGRCYVGFVITAGAAAVLASLGDLYAQPPDPQWLVLGLLILLSGSFTLKVPGISSSISVSETFVIITTVLFGVAPATVAVALEGLVISLWLLKNTREVYRVFFNMAAGAVSVWCSGHLFLFSTSGPVFGVDPERSLKLIPAIFVFAGSYFLLNSWLIAKAVASEAGIASLRVWWPHFTWLSLNYVGGASVAVLLLPYIDLFGLLALAIIAPVLALTYLTFRATTGRIEDTNRHLVELNRLYLSTVETLAMAIDAKDQITHGHVRRVQLYAVGLAKALRITNAEQLKAIEAAALLHDMGKLAVPEYILNKPGKLSVAEFDKMKQHASIGADILSAIEFPYPVVPIVRHHHENWDGTGYPDGLQGPAIPMGARVLAVVDCFDALTSDRPYRPRLSDAEAVAVLRNRRGCMYDPDIVDTFIAIYKTISPVVPESPADHTFAALAGGKKDLLVSNGLRHLDDIAASTEEMLTVYELARSLTGQMSLGDAADIMAKHLRRLIPLSLCVFYVYDRDSDELVAKHASGDHADVVREIRIPLGQRLTGWVGANRRSSVNADPSLDFGDIARALVPRPRSCLSTPLVVNGDLVGVLSLYSPSRDAFTDDHRRVAEAVASEVAKTVDHAARFDSVKTARTRDGLTGLPNVEQLLRLFSEIQASSGTPQAGPSLLLVNVEGLKQFEDPLAASRALATVLTVLGQSLRGADVLFRYASHQFVALLTQTDKATAETIADRIRGLLAGAPGDNPATDLSVGVGVATAPSDGRTLPDLLDAARERVVSRADASTRQTAWPSGTVH